MPVPRIFQGLLNFLGSDALTHRQNVEQMRAWSGGVRHELDELNLTENEGVTAEPTITQIGPNLLQISGVEANFRAASDFTGILHHCQIATQTVTVTDNAVNWISAVYNNGHPYFTSATANTAINEATVIPVARVYIVSGVLVYTLKYGSVGHSAAIRNFARVMRIRGNAGIERESGLVLSETATRVGNVTDGYVWFGVNSVELDEIAHGGTGVSSDLWYHNGGAWTSVSATQYNNTQYDDGNNIQTLTAKRYTVNWVFRNITTNHIDIVLGRGDYTLAQASASTLPALPPEIQYFYVLCGRIIVQKNATTATAIENVSTTVFTVATVPAMVVPIGGCIDAELSAGDIATYFDGTGLGIVGARWEGWAIRNGNNGTTNATGKFTRWNTAGSGGTGGSESSAHTHDRGAHAHAAGTLTAELTGWSGTELVMAVKACADWVSQRLLTITSNVADATKTANTGLIIDGSTASDGSGNTGAASATDNKPAYFSLVPLKRVS